jgi:Apea-like HEPN
VTAPILGSSGKSLQPPGGARQYSFVIFPYLKTSAEVSIGQLTFRSTDDPGDLPPAAAGHLREISKMLFMQDDLRIRSASYAAVPLIDLEGRDEEAVAALDNLAHLQAVVAYCYATPHPVFCDPFFRYEHASLAIFSPGKVVIFLVRPESHHHLDLVGPTNFPEPDSRGEIDGYRGLLNFKHHFWVINGSRLYPPIPQLGLNLSQDLAADFGQFIYDSSHLPLLLKLFDSPRSATSQRILRSIDWFNSSTSLTASEEESIVSLAIAFEALLGLPGIEEKTNRLVDSVALLLGRIPLLDSWVTQFYRARSEIVHEGHTARLRFVAGGSTSKTSGPLYHSLLAYGRQVFQMCVGTLLFGTMLAEKADLQEKLVTNQERFDEISRTLNDESIPPSERLRAVDAVVRTAERYRFVWESDFDVQRILNAMRAGAKAVLASDPNLDARAKIHFEGMASASRTDHYQILDEVRVLEAMMLDREPLTEPDSPRAIAFRLVRLTWSHTATNYFCLKRQRDAQGEEKAQ